MSSPESSLNFQVNPTPDVQAQAPQQRAHSAEEVRVLMNPQQYGEAVLQGYVSQADEFSEQAIFDQQQRLDAWYGSNGDKSLRGMHDMRRYLESRPDGSLADNSSPRKVPDILTFSDAEPVWNTFEGTAIHPETVSVLTMKLTGEDKYTSPLSIGNKPEYYDASKENPTMKLLGELRNTLRSTANHDIVESPSLLKGVDGFITEEPTKDESGNILSVRTRYAIVNGTEKDEAIMPTKATVVAVDLQPHQVDALERLRTEGKADEVREFFAGCILAGSQFNKKSQESMHAAFKAVTGQSLGSMSPEEIAVDDNAPKSRKIGSLLLKKLGFGQNSERTEQETEKAENRKRIAKAVARVGLEAIVETTSASVREQYDIARAIATQKEALESIESRRPLKGQQWVNKDGSIARVLAYTVAKELLKATNEPKETRKYVIERVERTADGTYDRDNSSKLMFTAEQLEAYFRKTIKTEDETQDTK